MITDLIKQLSGEEVKADQTELDVLGLEEGGKMPNASSPVKMDFRDARRGGYYWLDGDPYVSVTNAIGVLDKPALRYWFGREVWRAMSADPTLSEKDALGAPYRVSDDAKSRGSTIHSIVEAYRHTEEYIETVPSQFKGYAQAFYRWTADNHIAIVEHERTVVSRKHGYAGTLDLLVNINGNEMPIIIDVKTGKDIYPEAYLQLAAYRQALKENGQETAGSAVLLLQEDGSFKYQFTQEDYFRTFFACLVIFQWQHAEEMANLRQYAPKGGKTNA